MGGERGRVVPRGLHARVLQQPRRALDEVPDGRLAPVVPSSRVACRRQARRLVGVDRRLDDGRQVAAEDRVEVVGLVARAVVGDAVLGEVVRADALGAVDGADLAAPGLARRRGGLLLRAARMRARRTRMPCSRFCSCDFSFCIDTTMPVGRCVIRTAESVVLTDCPPGPDER